MKILIVDDNKTDRILLSTALSIDKNIIIDAINGIDALYKIKNHRPDLIISDIMMPMMDGFMLLKNVKQNSWSKDIPFIFYSAVYSEQEDIELAKTLGASKFITKHTDINDLIKQIKQVIDDVDKGKIKSSFTSIQNDQYKNRYNNIIFHKLEEKIAQLEKEIEKRKMIENALEKSEHIAHVGHWEWYSETNKLTWSDEMFHIFGITKDQFEEFQSDADKITEKTVHPDDIDIIRKSNMRIISEKQTFPLEYRVVWPDSTIHTVLAQPGEKILNSSGDITRLFGIVQDITERKQIENAITESKEKYKSLFEGAIDAVFVLDLETGIILDANLQAEKLVNSHRDQIVGKHYSILYQNENAGHINKSFCPRMNMVLSSPIYQDIITSDGNVVPVEINSGTVKLPNGKQIIQGIFRDITDRKLTEEKLKKSEENLRYAQRVSHTGNWEWDIKQDKITWSEETFRIHGLDPTKQEPNYEQLLKLYHHEDIPEFSKLVNECVYNGTPYTVVCRIQHSDGSLHHMEGRGEAIRDDNGNIVKLFGTSADITERKIVEEKLKKSEQLYRTMTECSNDSIWSLDKYGEFTFMNKRLEEISGYKFEELKGKTLPFLVSKHDIERVNNIIKTVLEGTAQQFEMTYNNKYNNVVTLSVNSAPIYSYGNIVGVISSGRDITETVRYAKELKMLTDKLETSNRDLEQFAYTASHDLQEPLRTVCGFAELLESNYKGKLGPDADEFIGYITSGAKRLQQMINDILALSRIGTKGKEFVPTNVERILRIVSENLHSLIDKNRAIITYDQIPTIIADESQIVQLFQNLIDNAIKFRREETPKIHISCKRSNGEWIFCVKDNGIGIDKNQFKKLFIIFQRLHSREEYPGTGIGLAICKKIVERHGGKIWLESDVGIGSTFFFTIPARQIRNN